MATPSPTPASPGPTPPPDPAPPPDGLTLADPATTPDGPAPGADGGLLDGIVDAVTVDHLNLPDVGVPFVDVPGPGDLVDGIAQSLIDRFFEQMANALASAVTRVNELVFSALDSTTTVDLSELSGGGLLQMTTSIGVTLVLAFFFAAIVRGLVRGEYSAISRAALVDVPLAIVGTVAVVTFAQMLLAVTDAATGALLDQAAADLAEPAVVISNAGSIVGGGLVAGFVVIVYIVAALLTWLWLFLRAALIYFLVVAAPIGLATRAFPPAAIYARRTIEMGVALIVSKLFLAIALALGASQMQATATGDADLSTMLVGAATMTLAAFMPAVVLKLIPIAEGATTTAGVERAPLRMAAAAGGIALAAGAAGAAGTAGAAGRTNTATGGGPAAPNQAPPPAGGGGPGSSTGGGPGGAGSTSPPGGPGGSGGPGSTSSPGGSGGNGGPGSVGPVGAGGGDGVSAVAIGGGGVATITGQPDPTSDGGGSLGDL